MGVEGAISVVDWVTCDFPAQLQIMANTASSKTAFNEIVLLGIISCPICMKRLKLNFYRTRIDNLCIQDLFGIKILNRYAFAQSALAFGFSQRGDSEPV